MHVHAYAVKTIYILTVYVVSRGIPHEDFRAITINFVEFVPAASKKAGDGSHNNLRLFFGCINWLWLQGVQIYVVYNFII